MCQYLHLVLCSGHTAQNRFCINVTSLLSLSVTHLSWKPVFRAGLCVNVHIVLQALKRVFFIAWSCHCFNVTAVSGVFEMSGCDHVCFVSLLVFACRRQLDLYCCHKKIHQTILHQPRLPTQKSKG